MNTARPELPPSPAGGIYPNIERVVAHLRSQSDDIAQRCLQSAVAVAASRLFEDKYGQRLRARSVFNAARAVAAEPLSVWRCDAMTEPLDIDRPDLDQEIRRCLDVMLLSLVDETRNRLPNKAWPPLLQSPELYIKQEAYMLTMRISMRVAVPMEKKAEAAEDTPQGKDQRECNAALFEAVRLCRDACQTIVSGGELGVEGLLRGLCAAGQHWTWRELYRSDRDVRRILCWLEQRHRFGLLGCSLPLDLLTFLSGSLLSLRDQDRENAPRRGGDIADGDLPVFLRFAEAAQLVAEMSDKATDADSLDLGLLVELLEAMRSHAVSWEAIYRHSPGVTRCMRLLRHAVLHQGYRIDSASSLSQFLGQHVADPQPPEAMKTKTAAAPEVTLSAVLTLESDGQKREICTPLFVVPGDSWRRVQRQVADACKDLVCEVNRHGSFAELCRHLPGPKQEPASATTAETPQPVRIRHSDLKLIDELLCDLYTLLANAMPPDPTTWRKVENYSSITLQAMARLRQAWETGEMGKISAGLAEYFRKTGTQSLAD